MSDCASRSCAVWEGSEGAASVGLLRGAASPGAAEAASASELGADASEGARASAPATRGAVAAWLGAPGLADSRRLSEAVAAARQSTAQRE